jgi:hypothetical protein
MKILIDRVTKQVVTFKDNITSDDEFMFFVEDIKNVDNLTKSINILQTEHQKDEEGNLLYKADPNSDEYTTEQFTVISNSVERLRTSASTLPINDEQDLDDVVIETFIAEGIDRRIPNEPVLIEVERASIVKLTEDPTIFNMYDVIEHSLLERLNKSAHNHVLVCSDMDLEDIDLESSNDFNVCNHVVNLHAHVGKLTVCNLQLEAPTRRFELISMDASRKIDVYINNVEVLDNLVTLPTSVSDICITLVNNTNRDVTLSRITLAY